MKTLKLGSLALALLILMGACGESAKNEEATTTDAKTVNTDVAKAVDYAVNLEKSTVSFIGYKLNGQHSGDFKLSEGKLQLEGDVLKGGNFTIDVSTMAITDAEEDLSPEYRQQLHDHLIGPDFFNADSDHEDYNAEDHGDVFTTAAFEITSIKAGDNGYQVEGNLTLKGVTKNIAFPASVSVANGEVTATAEFAIDRTKWNIQYGSGSLFDIPKDKAIDDKVDMAINLVATAPNA